MRAETALLVPIAVAAMDSAAGFPTGLDMATAATKLRRELGCGRTMPMLNAV